MKSLYKNETPLALGDKRLSKRYSKIIKQAIAHPSSSIPQAFQEWKDIKAVYRFFDNPNVNASKILSHEYQETVAKINSLDTKDILILQDTTSLNYSNHHSKKELGSTSNRMVRELNAHVTLAIAPNKVNLGLIEAKLWTRNQKKTNRHKTPIEEKESYKWIASLKATHELGKVCAGNDFFNIGDREADIYDFFLEALDKEIGNVYFIVRSAQNRLTNTPEKKLRNTMKKANFVGNLTFEYKRGNEKRVVTQNVRAQEIELSAPIRRPSLKKIKVHALLATEENPPKGSAPIEWLIITNYPVINKEDAMKILRYYSLRWEIEIFFKVLKTGCRVESLRLTTFKRIQAGLLLYMAIACKILYLLNLGKSFPDLPCEILFSSAEWKLAFFKTRAKIPKSIPSLGEMIICIAQLGGYINRKNDPPPGPKAIWVGMERMHLLSLGIEMSKYIHQREM